MFRRRPRRAVPQLNTTSTADISFMLLVFFLVTTSIAGSHGLLRRLAPKPTDEQKQEMTVSGKDALAIDITAGDTIKIADRQTEPDSAARRITAFLVGANPGRHTITLTTSPEATYEAYFAVQHAIADAYKAVRERRAREHYATSFARLTDQEQRDVMRYWPQRVIEKTSPSEE